MVTPQGRASGGFGAPPRHPRARAAVPTGGARARGRGAETRGRGSAHAVAPRPRAHSAKARGGSRLAGRRRWRWRCDGGNCWPGRHVAAVRPGRDFGVDVPRDRHARAAPLPTGMAARPQCASGTAAVQPLPSLPCAPRFTNRSFHRAAGGDRTPPPVYRRRYQAPDHRACDAVGGGRRRSRAGLSYGHAVDKPAASGRRGMDSVGPVARTGGATDRSWRG